MRRTIFVTLGLAALLGACDDGGRTEAPPSAPLTRDAIGHYCGMIVADHEGPKGQIHLAGESAPVWFSSVRDTVAFTMLPEESDDIVAIYVHDIGSAAEWAHPGDGAWIDARTAHYVIGSSRRGGMGAPEAVPFAERADAEAFAAEYGGRVVAFDDIPQDYILGDVGAQGGWDGMEGEPGADEGHGEQHGHGEGERHD